MRLHAAKPTRRSPAIAKRRPAPQKGGSSRLLKRTATKFVPPIRTTATNTERTAVDGRFITPTIRVSARPYPLADGLSSRRDGRAARGHEALRRHRRGRPPQPHRSGRAHLCAHRTVRMWQDDVASHGEQAHRADVGRDPYRWAKRPKRGFDAA